MLPGNMIKEDIIRLWKNVGWNSSKDYHNYLFSDKRDIELTFSDNLHPSKVNVKEFWKATDEMFHTDTVANSNNNLGITYSRSQANYHNHLIPLFLGLYGGMEFAILNARRKFSFANIAEIGCGYGSFREHFIKNRTNVCNYTGFDILQRDEYVVEIEGEDGTFSERQLELYSDPEVFNIFYSCNVFQHLTESQILKYFSQVYKMLPFGGFFVFSYVKKPEKGFTYHYGQKIEVMDVDYFKERIIANGFKICYYYEELNCNANTLTPIGFVIEKN